MINAKVIEDSISPDGVRLITLEGVFPRFELASFNTYRVFSRNSRSSRAVPIEHVMKEVRENPFMFDPFLARGKGMQPAGALADQVSARMIWLDAMDAACAAVRKLLALGVAKEQANRLLEPFMFHSVVVTSTEWDNFFEQRCHPDAQREIRLFAEAAREAISLSRPRPVCCGDWHLPYITADERATNDIGTLIDVSVGRCAGISYLKTNHSIVDALRIRDRLFTSSPPHLSPFEHPATPARNWHRGNFRGWRQERARVEDLRRGDGKGDPLRAGEVSREAAT